MYTELNLYLILYSKFCTLYKNKFIKHKTTIHQKIEEKLWYLGVVKSLDLTPKVYPIKFINLIPSNFKTIALHMIKMKRQTTD